MADPFSIVAGIIGIATAAAHTARRLKEFLDSIKETPDTIKLITKELGILQFSLIALEDLLRGSDDLLEVARTDEGRRCITSLSAILTQCQHTLESIHRTVEPFVVRRNGDRDHRWKTVADWVSRKDTLDLLKRELVNAKMTLDLGVSFAGVLLTRGSLSQLQTQFTQLNTRMEPEASEDSMSDIGSSSAVTDLGFTLKRFLREHDTSTVVPGFLVTADGKRSAADLINDNFGSRTRKQEAYPPRSSPLDSPLTKRTTFSSLEPCSSISPVTTFSSTFPAPEQRSRIPNMKQQNEKHSEVCKSTPINSDRSPEHMSLELKPSSAPLDGNGWDQFQTPLRVFSNYFGLSFKKMINKSPTSMLNFGIIAAVPTSNTAAYIDNDAVSDTDGTENSWDKIIDPKIHRRSAPNWTLKAPSHKASGKPPTKGVSQVSLSRVVVNGSSYNFIRLFLVAQKPQNTTAYNFQSKPFCAFTYVSRPRKTRDIGTDDESTDSIKVTPDATPASVWLEIKDEMLTFRLKSGHDKEFLDADCAHWYMDPDLVAE